ncbi:hypothetical protein ACQJBY_024390 [Aegilops geniculata]
MNVALMCAARRAREASLAIGVPLTEPLRMRAEGEAWVAIGVPLMEPRPRRKPSPYELPLVRCFMIVAGIIFTTIIIMGEGPLATKILGLCMLWAFMIGLLWATFEACRLPDVDTTES